VGNDSSDGGWAAVGSDNTGWAAAARSFLSQSGCGSGAGGCAHLGIQLTYDGLDLTIVSYLLFMLVRTDRHKLPLIYVS
jgi:hypothetical protein